MRLGVTLILVCLFLAVGFLSVRAAGFYRKVRGKRIVTCPETMTPATVDIATGRPALETFLGQPHLQIIHCSHWPERLNCAQLCRAEIEVGKDISVPEPECCD